MLEDLQALGVAFISLAEGIDATTPAGRLQMHLLAASAEFERERIGNVSSLAFSGPRAQGRRSDDRRPRVAPARRIV